MSSRRRSRRSPPSAAAGEPQAALTTTVADELVSRLRALLPPGAATTPSTAQVLEETAAYIRTLHAEVDGLGERLARLMPEEAYQPFGGAADDDAAQFIIRALLM
ncbi:transcription factor PRE6 [Panicum miliaceum]|uniref:Transcription factor PRE6 n=1 Tax=Panicum miliaceum TaxID=4540 RepID=A0A3L6PZ48_PANMI|nr:transcription factor PRE6 [Panicum miliaceum]